MAGNSAKRPNQYAGGPALGSIFIGLMGPSMMDSHWDDGPKYRGTNTSMSSRRTCYDVDDSAAPYAPDMIPSPLGRGLPSRHGFGKSF